MADNSAGYASLAALIPELAKLVVGAWQTSKGNKLLRDLQDPRYEIPKSAEEALALSKNLASSRQLPGYENYLNSIAEIMAGTGYQVGQTATTASEALGAINAADTQQRRMANDLAIKSAESYESRQRDVMDMLAKIAGYEDTQWEQNVLNPFLRKSTAGQAMVGAGMQNLMGGVRGASGVGANYALMDKDGGDTKSLSISADDVDKLRQLLDMYGSGGNQVGQSPAFYSGVGADVPYTTSSGAPGTPVDSPVIPWWTNFD